MVQGYVYILGSELGIYKIGRTKNIDLRMKQLQGVPFKTELIHSIACEDDVQFEAELHDKFKDKRKTGEWFELAPEDIEGLKSIKYVEAKNDDLITLRLSKEQHDNLLEMLQKYAEQKEGFTENVEVNIHRPELQGNVIGKSFKSYEPVFNDFIEFCKGRKETQKDLLALALIEFMDKYK